MAGAGSPRPSGSRGGSSGPQGGGHLEPTPPTLLLGWAFVGLGFGWLLRPLSQGWGANPPTITWAQPLALYLVAAILGYTAWSTWRTVHVRRERLAPHQGVNRLVLARACALVGSFMAGGYLGYALSWVGDPAVLAEQRLVRGVLAAVGGVAMAVAAVLLERACRIRDDDGDADVAT